MRTAARDRSGLLILSVGTLLSLGLGVLFYVRGDVPAALAVVAGLEVLTITLIFQLINRDASRLDQITRQSRLFARAESLQWFPEWLDDATKALEEIREKFRDTPVEDEARHLLDDTLRTLHGLRGGHLHSDYEVTGLLIDRMNRAQNAVRATTVWSVEGSWWKGAEPNRYWEAQLAALKRGVSIERVFLYDTWDNDIDLIAKNQRSSGVVVLRVLRSSVPASLRKGVVLWDNDCAYEVRLVGDGSSAENFFTVDSSEIGNIEQSYERVREMAQPL